MSLLNFDPRLSRVAAPVLAIVLLTPFCMSTRTEGLVHAYEKNEPVHAAAVSQVSSNGLLSGIHAKVQIRAPDDVTVCANLGWPQILDSTTDSVEEHVGGVKRRNVGQPVVERQNEALMVLENNTPLNKNITSGQTQYWLVSSQVLDAPAGDVGAGLPGQSSTVRRDHAVQTELKRQSGSRPVWITINVCTQPEPRTIQVQRTIPPSLTMYLSQDSSNRQPGPSSLGVQQVKADQGYAVFNVDATQELYVGVAAANNTNFVGSWNYEIAASIDAAYHQVEEATPYLHFVDADNHAALLITDNLTSANPDDALYQQWMELSPPFGMFAHDKTDARIDGVRKSYCGLSNSAKVVANQAGVENQNVATMTNRGKDGKPKEQIYLTALNASSQYWGILAMQGNSTAHGRGVVGGGGKVWAAINFTTKAESNCALMYNLTFCSEVAYAVPTNPELFSPRGGLPQLSAIYDTYASQMYQNFNFSLQQIACNTSAASQYSLARTCDDCAAAYKQWLCAVTIPRCEDFTNDRTWLHVRNVGQPFANGTSLDPSQGSNRALLQNVATNSSRSAIIDAQIRPGPYKEVLPCEDLCYDLVKSCPAALGFGCPVRGAGLNNSYGFRSDDAGQITCSYLGAAYYLGDAGRGPLEQMMFGITVLWVWTVFVGMLLT